MTREEVFETLTGALVIIAAAVFFLQSYKAGTAGSSGDTYTLKAIFSRVDGLNTGADVKVAGVKVGTVSNLVLDAKSYRAQAVLQIDRRYRFAQDSGAKIAVDGLLGGSHVNLEPGSDATLLEDGGEVEQTQGAINLTDLLAKAVFGGGSAAK